MHLKRIYSKIQDSNQNQNEDQETKKSRKKSTKKPSNQETKKPKDQSKVSKQVLVECGELQLQGGRSVYLRFYARKCIPVDIYCLTPSST